MSNQLISRIKEVNVADGELYFWWFGQMGWCVKTSKHTLYLDLFLSLYHKRIFPPVLAPELIDNADIVLCTHDHIDHIDHPTLPKIMAASTSASLLVPTIAVDKLVNDDGIEEKRIVPMSVGEHIEIAGCKITPIKAMHEAFDYTDEYGYPYLQYIVEVDGMVIYHSGDTLLYNGMQTELEQWNIDIAFVPINGRDSIRYRRNCMGCMTWQEAADLCGSLKPRMVCPGHWDMFADNSENPLLFEDYCRVKYPELSCWIGFSGNEGHL